MTRGRITLVLTSWVILFHSSGIGSDYCLDFGPAVSGTDSTLTLTVVLSETEPIRGFQFDIIDNSDDALILSSVTAGEKVESWQVPAVETSTGDVRVVGFSLSGDETSGGASGVLLEVTYAVVGPLGEEVAFHFGGQAGVHLVTGNLDSLACAYPDEDSPRVFPVDWLVVAGRGSDLPTTFAMESNYPNPFNATTVIPFQVPRAAPVALTVYNLLGQKVVTLVDATRATGYHRVSWDGRDAGGRPVSSGIYLVVFSSGGFAQRGKMVLLR